MGFEGTSPPSIWKLPLAQRGKGRQSVHNIPLHTAMNNQSFPQPVFIPTKQRVISFLKQGILTDPQKGPKSTGPLPPPLSPLLVLQKHQAIYKD